MLQSKSFVKKTKKGKVVTVVREHYLRDDIWSGSPLDPECDPSSYKLGVPPQAAHYLLVDANVAIHQMDLLEHSAIDDVIVCSTVLEEVKKQNPGSYQRLRQLCASEAKRFYVFANEHHKETYITALPGESPNDRNDRAIRRAAEWYSQRLAGRVPLLFLTNDRASREAALQQGLHASGTAAYARTRVDAPELLDIAARYEENEGEEPMEQDGPSGAGGSKKRRRIYTEHLPMSEVQAGMRSGRLHQGVLRVNRFNPFEGYVSSESIGKDILISGMVDMNRAMDGDVVAVEVLPEEQWRGASSKLPSVKAGDAEADGEEEEAALNDAVAAPEVFQVAPGEHYGDLADSGGKCPTGKVVGIIKRSSWRERGFCGAIDPPKRLPAPGRTASVLVVPVDRRFPKIRIQTSQAATLADKRLLVNIDTWEVDSQYPSGHYVRTLGTIGDKETETAVLLIENDINTSPFTPAVHACVPPLPWAVSVQDVGEPCRLDLRGLCICSVDPPGCKDIDDALHVRQLPNGNLEVGVHIADVTRFLAPGTAMDDEAASRATTVYLVGRRIDMLPKPLTEDICSLRGGVERLAFSVLWEMTPDANILATTFTKSVIKSRAAMTYAEAQARIDDPRLDDELTWGLRQMNRIAKILRKRRADAGALQLASPEVKFEIDTETHDPLDVGMYQVRETNQMVEEMMLLANISVAEKILRHFPTCSLLRRHQTPAPRQFEPLLKAAAAAGIELDVSTSRLLADSLDKAVRFDDPYFNKLVRIMCTRCMTQALYFGSGDLSPPEYRHYGLASEIYTHFTSPIRRYADVVVHRLLAAALGIAPLPESLRDKAAMRACSDNLNVRHRNAQMAGRSSVELHTLIFFKSRTVVADARVTKVKANGLIVFVPKYGIEGPVYFAPKAGSAAARDSNNNAGSEEEWLLDVERQRVTARDGSVGYSVFDKCAVEIKVEETFGQRRQLVLGLVGRDRLAAAEAVG